MKNGKLSVDITVQTVNMFPLEFLLKLNTIRMARCPTADTDRLGMW